MKPEEINKAIAEACGWAEKHKGLWVESMKTWAALPNYHGDLNACAEFRRTLTDDQRLMYTIHLDASVRPLKDFVSRWEQDWAVADATAPQHCEAFLRLHGKWKEDAP